MVKVNIVKPAAKIMMLLSVKWLGHDYTFSLHEENCATEQMIQFDVFRDEEVSDFVSEMIPLLEQPVPVPSDLCSQWGILIRL